MRFRKSGIQVLLAAVVGWCLAVPAQAQANLEEVKVALSWLRTGEFSALMVADVKGYFAQEGLRLTLVDGGPGRNPIPAVGAGQADFGIAASADIIRARVAPSPVDIVALGAITQRMPLAYIKLANPGDPDPTPKDLEGKKVGIQAGGEIFLQALAKRNGVDMGKVKVETVLGGAEPLMMGKVDYFAGFITGQPYQIEQEAMKAEAMPAVKGKTWKAIPFHKFVFAMPTNVLFATHKTIKERPETIRKVMRALAKGMKFGTENPAEMVTLVAAYPGQLDRLDRLTWAAKLRPAMEQNDGTAANGLLWTDPKVWGEAMAFYKEVGEISKVVPPADIVTNAFNPGIKLAR